MIEIRSATTADISLIHSLARQVWFVTYGPLQPMEKIEYLFELMYTPLSLKEQMEVKKHCFILAKDESGYLGYASYEINAARLNNTKIHKIYVLPAAQGKGVGKAMVDWIGDCAREHNDQTLSLNVFRKNPALQFYQKLGFTVMKEVDVDVGNGITMNDFVMEKRLS
jgi:GNAT superfamily N-acetyltransferase